VFVTLNRLKILDNSHLKPDLKELPYLKSALPNLWLSVVFLDILTVKLQRLRSAQPKARKSPRCSISVKDWRLVLVSS